MNSGGQEDKAVWCHFSGCGFWLEKKSKTPMHMFYLHLVEGLDEDTSAALEFPGMASLLNSDPSLMSDFVAGKYGSTSKYVQVFPSTLARFRLRLFFVKGGARTTSIPATRRCIFQYLLHAMSSGEGGRLV